jgi:hypothetical protein
MFRNILKPNMVRHFNHRYCETNFKENNKVIEKLMREQNKNLNEIKDEISKICIMMGFLIVIVSFTR